MDTLQNGLQYYDCACNSVMVHSVCPAGQQLITSLCCVMAWILRSCSAGASAPLLRREGARKQHGRSTEGARKQHGRSTEAARKQHGRSTEAARTEHGRREGKPGPLCRIFHRPCFRIIQRACHCDNCVHIVWVQAGCPPSSAPGRS